MYLAPTSQISGVAKKMLSWFTSQVFIPAIKQKTPEAVEGLQKFVLERNEKSNRGLAALHNSQPRDEDLHELIKTNPFILIDMVSHAHKSQNVKNYFNKILTDKSINVDRIIDHLPEFNEL